MFKYLIAIVVLLASVLALNNAAATPREVQAAVFIKVYSKCLLNVQNLSSLRDQLKLFPPLPSHNARLFLNDGAGDAWPVPSEDGLFVLALPEGDNLCAAYGQRADTEMVKATFLRLVAEAPAPLISRKVKDEQTITKANGLTHTLAYEWYLPDVPYRTLYMLTIAPSETAQLQVVGTASKHEVELDAEDY